MNYRYILEVKNSDNDDEVATISAPNEEMLLEQLGKVDRSIKDYELSQENEITAKDIADKEAEIIAEYDKEMSKCCDSKIVLGHCSECKEGV